MLVCQHQKASRSEAIAGDPIHIWGNNACPLQTVVVLQSAIVPLLMQYLIWPTPASCRHDIGRLAHPAAGIVDTG